MVEPQLSWLYSLSIFLPVFCVTLKADIHDENSMKSAVYLSPEMVMKPGSVANKFYYNIDFPRGHVGIKSFFAEVVDEAGVSVPLHHTYLHHLLVGRYYFPVHSKKASENSEPSDILWVRNRGYCKNLGQYFGLGSETRKTATLLPDPYAIEVGNPDETPQGYKEGWMVNIHAIDTRGAVDRLGCTECKCSLYNVTIDEYGRPISPTYDGGLLCCYDGTHCPVKEGFPLSPRKLYLKYTIKWFDWNKSLLPIDIYLIDITDTWKASNGKHSCKIEYDVSSCVSSTMDASKCMDTKKLSFKLRRGGHVVYGVAHQHPAGVGSAVYRKDGRVICSSFPTYGKGNEAGNEAGYIVGMSTCYPEPGSVTIYDGETLILESNYSSSQKHTGVMSLFYILVAKQLPNQRNFTVN